VSAPAVRTPSPRGTIRAPGAVAPLVVSTTCPSCGGVLDIDEGSNAVRCGYCASNLLVTGRKRVLSFFVSPRVTGGDALSAARFAASAGGEAVRCDEPRLCFVPYYRFVADEYRWQECGEPEPAEERAFAETAASPRVASIRWSRHAPALQKIVGLATRVQAEIEFVGRRVERSFVACAARGFGGASLGMRSEVLALELFHEGALPRDAIVLAASPGPGAALERASAPAGDEGLIERTLVSRLLSIVHLPLWAVPVKHGDVGALVTIDGITGSVVAIDVPLGALDACAAPAVPAATLGFRPLLCPNCGGDLPLEPHDVIFACGACSHAWLIDGQDLLPVPFGVAAPPRGTSAADLDHRPIWILAAAGDPACEANPAAAPAARGHGLDRIDRGGSASRTPRCFVPAFHAPSLKLVKDLATRLSQRNPELELVPEAHTPLAGCVLDAADAAAVGSFVAAGTRLRRGPVLPAPLAELKAARLVWFPVVRQPYGWLETHSGIALPPDFSTSELAPPGEVTPRAVSRLDP
jgi:DNA-directed RNA polymerase subunit RPC12/RpoP